MVKAVDLLQHAQFNWVNKEDGKKQNWDWLADPVIVNAPFFDEEEWTKKLDRWSQKIGTRSGGPPRGDRQRQYKRNQHTVNKGTNATYVDERATERQNVQKQGLGQKKGAGGSL